jgi:hypothetical protein
MVIKFKHTHRPTAPREDKALHAPFQAWLHQRLDNDDEFKRRVMARMAQLDAVRRKRDH